MKNFDSIALAAGWRQALQDAIDSQNADDLYDAIADNGFETKESYQHGRDVAWMTKYAKDILAGRVKVSASAIRQHQVALAAVRRELAEDGAVEIAVYTSGKGWKRKKFSSHDAARKWLEEHKDEYEEVRWMRES
jgi:hypothetical protein